jgi:hypothetical protein
VNYRIHSKILFFHLFAVTLILVGCTEQIRQPTRICPGKKTAIEALSVLRSHSQKAVSLKAKGQCRLEYYADGKLKKENFLVRLWLNPVRNLHRQGTDVVPVSSNGMNPPAEIYMQGDVAFDPRAIVLGSNEYEFWLAIRLKEISSYWWGRWAETGSVDGLLIDPRTVLEALGIIEVDSYENLSDDSQNWSLSQEGAFDVLATRNDHARIIKKIYIYNCDYSVRKIQYLDIDGKSELVVELDKYEQVNEDFFAPIIIRISRHNENIEDQANISLSLTSIKPTSISSKQRNLLFNRPEPTRFKHFFEYINGKWIEQQQE